MKKVLVDWISGDLVNTPYSGAHGLQNLPDPIMCRRAVLDVGMSEQFLEQQRVFTKTLDGLVLLVSQKPRNMKLGEEA